MSGLKQMAVALFLMVVFSVSVCAQTAEYPAELDEIVQQYPESQVMSSFKQKEEINAMLISEEMETGTIIDFYKTSLTENDWEVDTEIDQGITKTIIFKTGDKQFVVSIACFPEKTMITLALSKSR